MVDEENLSKSKTFVGMNDPSKELMESTVTNRSTMHEVLVGVSHSGEEFFAYNGGMLHSADNGGMLHSSHLPDELVTLVDEQTSGKRMHSPEMTINSFVNEKLTVRERDDGTKDSHVDGET